MSTLSKAKDPLCWSCVSHAGSYVRCSKVPAPGAWDLALGSPAAPQAIHHLSVGVSPCCRNVAPLASWNPECDEGNFQVLMFVGPPPGLPRKLHFYQGQNVFTTLQNMGSISALSTYCTSALLANDLKETFQAKVKSKTLPTVLFPYLQSLQPCTC